MIVPPALKKGDRVGIVSTARKIMRESLIAPMELIRSWGFEPVLGKTIGLVDHQFAGTNEARTADFQSMLDDPSIKAIFCARGGYGTIKIIDQLDFSRFKQQAKWIVGFSDVTVLHSHIHRNIGVQTLHATMPIVYETTEKEALDNLRSVLMGEKLQYKVPYHSLDRFGQSEGVLVGGNLSLIYCLIGSQSDIDTKGKILFLEDLDEYLYHIDRMMIALDRAGMLAELKGLIIGGMTDMNDNSIPYGHSAVEIIREYVDNYTYPVKFNFPAGHIVNNKPLIIGGKLQMKVEQGQAQIQMT